MPRDFASKTSLKEIKDEIIKSYVDVAYREEEVVRIVDETEDEIDARMTIDKMAFGDTLDALVTGGVLEKIIYGSAVDACYQTNEFNFGPYVSHLYSALKANIDNIIKIEPLFEQRTVMVYVNLDSLGTVDEWEAAIKAVRDEKHWGAYTKQIKEWEGSEDSDDANLASHFWREKIYAVDREGGTVERPVTTKTKNRDGTTTTRTKMKDVTGKYRGKYTATVEKRLEKLDGDKAPYWYLIENGNTTVEFSDSPGSPYPVFGPTNFTDIIRNDISAAFEETYNKYIKSAEEKLVGFVYEDFGLKGHGKSLDDLNLDLYKGILGSLTELGAPEVIERGQSRLTAIREADTVLETYAPGGVLRLSRRGAGGRFVKV